MLKDRIFAIQIFSGMHGLITGITVPQLRGARKKGGIVCDLFASRALKAISSVQLMLMSRISTPFRLISLAVILLVVGMSSGCQSNTITVTVPRIERYQFSDPDASRFKIDRALSERAEAYARTHSGAQVWRGHGLSMEPLIPPHAWIVSERLPYETLKPGQVVLYNSSSGRRVAHALVKKMRDGWITIGVNNEQRIDDTRVTFSNYIGVITAAFVADK